MIKNIKNGDLVQINYSKELGIIIDDFEQKLFESLNAAFVSNMSRKILVFKEKGLEIDFVPNFNITLIESKKEKNDTKI